MRVVAGAAGGRVLRSPKGRQLRPTSERVREAVFSALESMGALQGATVLDLYAGTGALGIEALSRGAAGATFVDADGAAVAVIEENLRNTGLGGPHSKVVRTDVLRFLDGQHDHYDLAFVDPPYAFEEWAALLTRLRADLAVLEARRPVELVEGWVEERERRYGGTVVTIARRL